MSLEGKVALVTGATRGIGLAIAHALAKQGAYVIGTATKAEGVAHIQKGLTEATLKGEAVQLDVTEPEAIKALLERLVQDERAPAILVNNAAITADDLLLRMEDADWFRVIETNLSAVYRVTQACLKPMFRARFGRIINVSSVVAFSGNAGQVNYAAAKAGVIGFSKSLAQEMASRHITVNVVAPGFIETDMTAKLPDLVKETLLSRIPMKCLGRPEDVAEAVCFLASDGAKYITGQTIHVNGGMYM